LFLGCQALFFQAIVLKVSALSAKDVNEPDLQMLGQNFWQQ
jgi:hypothetical protein